VVVFLNKKKGLSFYGKNDIKKDKFLGVLNAVCWIVLRSGRGAGAGAGFI
jgi:hypothetical protein